MQALYKNRGLGVGQQMLQQFVPGYQPPGQQTTPQQPQTPAAPPSPYANLQFPKPGDKAQYMDIPGKGHIPVQVDKDNHVWTWDQGTKQWAPLQY
jgi:hypothetical protein